MIPTATLCIADPPYPPSVAMRYDVPGGRVVSRSRARRYYGDGTRCATERPADFHPAAGEWDNPARGPNPPAAQPPPT